MGENELYEANDTLAECRAMWLKLGRHLSEMAVAPDFIDSVETAAQSLELAAQAEACFWRATGDEDCASISHWVPALRKPTPPSDHSDSLGGRDDV